jgi:heme A synthase
LKIELNSKGYCPQLRGLAFVTVASIFFLIILGGVVRVTESGLGCPDWPLCHGEIIPSYKLETLIEYSHRLVAFVVATLVLVMLVVVWLKYRSERLLLHLSLAGFILVIVQAGLGGITVLTGLAGNMVTIHLGLAQILLALFTLIVFVIVYGANSGAVIFHKHKWLLMATITCVFALLLSGSYTTTTGASGACDQWPFCQSGSLLINSKLPVIHMIHRIIAVAAGILIVASMHLAWKTRKAGGNLYSTGVILGFVFVIQIVVGAATVLLDLPADFKIIHLFVATLMWWLTVIMFLLLYYRGDNRGIACKLETS